MNPKIFLSTFVLIFLAELGDKTQLAAMARAASSGSAKWTIFLAASAALVVSTLVAVLFGSVLTRLVPERYIRIAAGVLFLLFGFLLLRESLVAPGEKAPSAEVRGLAGFVFSQAAEFEKSAFEDYRLLASRSTDPALRSLLENLAAEEDEHYRRLEEFRRA